MVTIKGCYEGTIIIVVARIEDHAGGWSSEGVGHSGRHTVPCYACVHDGLICPASARAAPELLLQHERMHNEAILDERGARLSLVASRYGKVGLLYYTQLYSNKLIYSK